MKHLMRMLVGGDVATVIGGNSAIGIERNPFRQKTVYHLIAP